MVPLLEAVRRGASRAVVVSNYPMAPAPVPTPRNAFDVLLRSLTLSMLNPGPNEMQHGDLYARARRQMEHEVCRERFASWQSSAAEADAFCVGDGDGDRFTSALPQPAGSEAFRSAWVFRTEGTESELGYAFDPKAMRELFMHGVSAFQERCHEVLDVLGIEGEAARATCSTQDASLRPKLKDLAQCKAREIRECEGPIACKAQR
jgi:hypothetical protein